MPELLAGGFVTGPGFLGMRLNFTTPMNVDIIPSHTAYVTMVDGISRIEQFGGWTTNGTFEYQVTGGPPASTLTVQFLLFGQGAESIYGVMWLGTVPMDVNFPWPPLVYY